ncbi:dynein intermediate chain, putative [Plasmodium ovale]|uniref:Dynein intermediate chain, putative n=1 Tax=Plasmodium ovale TaxID=36330 RepID=A0A1D3U7U6_PLAOA|nr:dynein intermediate chain, putative [Plasmodium ovale]
MKSTALEKKKKKKVPGSSEMKSVEGEGAENSKRKSSLESNKNETLTRFLFPKNPRAFKSLIEFSFSNEQFVPIDNIDHTVFHLDLKSCLVQKESDEGKKQIELIKKKIEKANSFTVLKDSDCIYHKPKNCFDYTDRYAQTMPVSFKDESTKTVPQEINEICDTVCQSIIYDAYLRDFQNLSNGDDKAEKDKYGGDMREDEGKNKKYSSTVELGFGANGYTGEGSDRGSGNQSDDAQINTVLFSSACSSDNSSEFYSEDGNYKDSLHCDEDEKEEKEKTGEGRREGYDGETEDEKSESQSESQSEYQSESQSESLWETEEEEAEREKDGDKVDNNGERVKENKDGISGKNDTKNVKELEGCRKKNIVKKKKKKKKKKESISGKHELYFINYKDIKEKKFRELSFMYHDYRIKKSDNKIIYKKRFLKTLKLMDRIYNKNNEEDIYLSYKCRNSKNILTKLWTFSLTSYQLVVTDIKFHPFYEDLFSISYKNNDFKMNMGILCCFSFKNTKSPEYVIRTNFPIHSIEWSSVNCSIIILGLSNGNICIYDLRKKKKERLIFESNIKEIYNRDIISQICFHKKTKTFYSVSYDGHIYQWKYNNKFTVGEKLLTLEKDLDDFNENINTIHTQSITCIDFNPFQKNLFLIGTNKGKIYLYSSTYSDNYLNVYNEHSMSINSISYNKFKLGIFLSSSYDWTIRIWDQRRARALIVFDIKECVYDVSWSPFLSTCFFVISANTHGRLHIYDVSVDINKAVLIETIAKRKKLRKLGVNQFNEVILIGEEGGHIYSYKISYTFNQMYMDYLKGKISRSFQTQIMDSFLRKVQ